MLDPSSPLEITEEEFKKLVQARVVLNAAFSLEEIYDLLVGNFVELENSALTLATTTMIRRFHEYDEMFEFTSEMNRRAVNFLSTARLFVDQVVQRFGDCGFDNTIMKARLNMEYDHAYEYRFMEAIRNHVQHSGSAVHGLSFGGGWESTKPKEKKIFAMGVFTQKRFLVMDKTFKKDVLADCPDQVNFLRYARVYLGGLSDAHDFARVFISDAVTEARTAFADAIAKYKEFSEGKTRIDGVFLC